MTRCLKRIGPLSLAKVCAVLYGLGGLIAAPIILLTMLAGTVQGGQPPPMAMLGGGLAAVVLLPFLYAVLGFLGGLILACLYNLVARWLGGVEFEAE